MSRVKQRSEKKGRQAETATPRDPEFGALLRQRREALREDDRRFSLRQVAERIGVEPSYLSKVERGEAAPPSEETIVRLASDLELDPDALLALAGKVSSDLKDVIRRRPELFGRLIRELRDLPDHAVLRIAREVRDGEW
jgi:transcriptional regulator with XRE-family HTH domain